MKKKLLCCALLGAMGMAQSVMAQSYDDRWYITAGAGFNFQDTDRHNGAAPEINIGFGRFWAPNWSWDIMIDGLNPTEDKVPGPGTTELHWAQYGISLDARYHFIKEGRNWAPYLVGGIGWQKSEREWDAFPSPDSPQTDDSNNIALKFGAGLQGDMGERIGMRVEAGIRADFNDAQNNGLHDLRFSSGGTNAFYDPYVTATILFPLGSREVEAVTPVAPPPADCSTMDDDADGVNNCNDKCPGTPAGQAIGPDGCPLPVEEPAPEPKPFRG